MTVLGSTIIRGGVIAAVFITILLVILLLDRNDESHMQSSGTTYGRILVDSPEVYTRERMVNDRFRQEAWLLEQLDKLTDEKPGYQGVVEEQTSRRRDASLLFGPKTSASNAVAGEETKQRESGAEPQLTPIESFRGQQSVRDEVRNALIENQLDDRHDLDGNTLYRLKFDATVIPGNDTSAWAQIKVWLKERKKLSNDEKTLEFKELFRRWMSDLQEEVDAFYSDEFKKTAKSNDENNTELYNLSMQQISSRVKRFVTLDDLKKKIPGIKDKECVVELLGSKEGLLHDYSSRRFDCLMDFITTSLRRKGICVNDDECEEILVRQIVMNKVISIYDSTLGKRESMMKIKESRKPRANQEEWSDSMIDLSSSNQSLMTGQPLNKKFVTFSPDSDSNSIRVEEYIEKIYAVPHQFSESELYLFSNYLPDKIYAIPTKLETKEREIYKTVFSENNPERDTEKNPITDAEIIESWTSYLECKMKVINVDKREYKICESSFNNLNKDIINVRESPPSLKVKIKNDFDGLPFFYPEDLNREAIIETWTKIMVGNCIKTANIQVGQQKYTICNTWIKGLEDFAIHKGTGEEPLSLDVEIQSSDDGYHPPFFKAKVGYMKFRQKLDKPENDKFIFSYAVTPRESSQQLASSSRLAVAEQIRASAADSVTGIEGGAERSNIFSEYAQILERRPIIVGIASHESDPNHPKSAELGWLIGPKLVINKDGKATYRQLPSQNSLSALVSVPSWWRRADIEIETGWLDNQGELVRVPEKYSYTIALPGDQDEITSTLLGGNRPAPSIEDVEPKFVKAGEEIKFLIQGTNLWRSTVVTIGARRSKKIFVLPNMKGIIAEFDPIDVQSTKIEGKTAKLRVWTSEGVISWKDEITVKTAATSETGITHTHPK